MVGDILIEQNWLEIIGYMASVFVAISLMMSSIVKLRVINLIGAILFMIYSYLIGALPVFFVNLFISVVNIYYLNKIYSEKTVD